MRQPAYGFTLIELVIVIALTAIVAGLSTHLIRTPLLVYADVAARAKLVDRAETALRRMARDLERALPNSVRVSGNAIELLYVVDGAPYRREFGQNPDTAVNHAQETDRLDFGDDSSWNVLGRLVDLAPSYGSALPAGMRAAIYPTSAPPLYAQAAAGTGPGSVTPASTSITILDDGDEDQVQLSAPYRFALESPAQRLYLVEGPVTFLCDPGAGTLRRFSSYAIAAAQPVDPTLSPLASAGLVARLADAVASCRFVYAPGTPSRASLVTLELELALGTERIRLLEQVHVVNAP